MTFDKTAVVNLAAIKNNIKAVLNHVGSNVVVMPAVKANGYGHGSAQVSHACVQAGAKALCVSCTSEAIVLRKAGIDAPILILGCLPNDACEDIAKYDLTTSICDLDFAKHLSETAEKLNKKVKVHIKLDTGMGRLGIQTNEIDDFISKIRALPNIEIEGVFTHFPSSDDPDRTFTSTQIKTFSGIIEKYNIPIAHASNSGAILSYPEANFNMVRPGILTYGLYPSDEIDKSIRVEEALTLMTKIVYLKELPKGSGISYGRTYICDKKTKIATLPIGYGDGYLRSLSNIGEVAVRGVRAPIVGRVCMDMCMIDVTDVPGVSCGDDVILYGGGYDFLNVSNIAKKMNTIPYELLCLIGNRIPRIYVGGD